MKLHQGAHNPKELIDSDGLNYVAHLMKEEAGPEIVRAVNAHAQLVEALEAIRDFDLEYEFNEPVNEWLESRGFSYLQDLARKALADAEAK